MRDIQERYDSSDVTKKIDLQTKGENWSPDKIAGIPKKNNLKYEKQFSLDIATTALTVDPVFGANTGGIVSLSDLLGDEKYYFLIFNNANGDSEFWKSFNIAISALSISMSGLLQAGLERSILGFLFLRQSSFFAREKSCQSEISVFSIRWGLSRSHTFFRLVSR